MSYAPDGHLYLVAIILVVVAFLVWGGLRLLRTRGLPPPDDPAGRFGPPPPPPSPPPAPPIA